MSMDTVIIAIEVWGVLFCIGALISIMVLKDEFPKKTSAILRFLTGVIAVVGCDIIFRANVENVTPLGRELLILSCTGLHIMGYYLLVYVGMYFVVCAEGEKEGRGFEAYNGYAWPMILKFFGTLGGGLALINLFYPFLFEIDEWNQYHRKTFYTFYIVLAIAACACLFYWCTTNYKRLSTMDLISLLSVIGISVLGLVFQLFFVESAMFLMSIMIAAMIAYVLYIIEIVQALLIKKHQFEEMQTKLIFSQVAPHFIYNTLASLRGLILDDPKKAYDMVGDFSSYLRANLNEARLKSVIGIMEELEAVDHYIELQRMRYGEELIIIYEVENEALMIPAMTIQPIVENAIKYAIAPKGGGVISISDASDEENDYIIITDDGDGKNTDSVEQISIDGTGIGIASVRYRLKQMCGGSLEIKACGAEGTKVTITLPKKVK